MLLRPAFCIVHPLSWLLWCLLLCCRPAAAAEAGGFERGNSLYSAGKYADAAAAYETALGRGEFSANLFYNLGDAYYRAGSRGRAILNYDRALLLDPGHAEARANLAFVRARGRSIDPVRTDWQADLADIPVDTYARGAALAFWLSVAGLLAATFHRRLRLLGFLAAVVLLPLCGGCIWAIRWLDDGARNPARAFVIEEDTPALYAPADTSKIIATLSSGSEVRILSDQGTWTYVRLANGALAWVPSSHIEAVLPRAAAAG